MLFCECDFCGKKRIRIFIKSYPSIWSAWKVYRFCNRECAKKFIERSREADLNRWHLLCNSYRRDLLEAQRQATMIIRNHLSK